MLEIFPGTRKESDVLGILGVYFRFECQVGRLTDKPEFWFNVRTNQVEVGPQSISLDRIGPFESAEAAINGPNLIAEKARRLREEDQKKWED